MAVCFCAVISDFRPSISFDVWINGESFHFGHCYELDQEIPSEHIFLFDSRRVDREAELESAVLKHEWNHVEVSFYLCVDTWMEDCYSLATFVKWTGIHVYKQKTRMEDIRFSNPNEESLPQFVEGASTNTCTSAEFVLRRCKWPHIDFRVIKGNSNKKGISLLFEP